MSDYVQIEFPIVSAENKDILIAKLIAAGFEGFEETEEGLKAFIPKEDFNENAMRDEVGFNKTIIKETNWNELWESNFEPVVVNDFVSIRASFHKPGTGVKHDIIITPKMSFGTGHHATTWMMISQMRELDLRNKTVLDFGTGTGVLAILAEKLGATKVVAIDNDDWSIENAAENISRNGCQHIELVKAETADREGSYDVVLANVNKAVIMENFAVFAKQLRNGGVLLLSGLLVEDKDVIFHMCNEYSLHLIQTTVQANWLCLRLYC